MIKFCGLILLLAGLAIGYVGFYAPMENMGTVGTIDGELWLRTSMKGVAIGSTMLGLMTIFSRSKPRNRAA